MASGRRGQNEVNLGAGHLVGIFLGVVVLCGIFFALGYVIGRGGSVGKVAATNGNPPGMDDGGSQASGNGAPISNGWDFFPNKSSSDRSSGASGPASQPSAGPVTAASPAVAHPAGPISMSPKPAGLRVVSKPPRLPGGGGGVLLQVAAMTNRGDALSLAGFLRQKGYPAFAWGPAQDRLYRVQVGPYVNRKAAGTARLKLEKEGFTSILK